MATLDGRAGRAGAAPTRAWQAVQHFAEPAGIGCRRYRAAAATAIIMAIICFFIDPPLKYWFFVNLNLIFNYS